MHMKLAKLIFLSLACVMHAAPVAASAASPAADDLTPTSTPTITAAALADLEAAQAFIRATHPGAVPGIDEAFLRQLDAGFGEALALAAQLPAQDQALAAMKAYKVAFKDGHIWVTPPPNQSNDPMQWAGWTAAPTGQRYLVRDVAPSWQGVLPAPGDELVRCDGQPIDAFLQARIAPFVDRRHALEGVRATLALLLTNRVATLPLPASSMPRECTFRSPNGIASTLPVVWTQSQEGFRMNAFTRAAPGVKRWRGGYWVYANEFYPPPSKLEAVQRLVQEVASIPAEAPFVVFDTRGNEGGSSVYGYELLSALMKSGMPAGNSGSTARWRVSSLKIEQLRQELAKYPASASETMNVQVLNSIIATLVQAQQEGKVLAEQETRKLKLRLEIPADTDAAFKGRVILVTDSRCASACMDFVDMVRSVPGMLHVGRETSGDTNYMEIIHLPLPSGATLVTPTKVWSGRTRGINESAKPHEEFLGDIRDTGELRKWLAERLQRL